MTKVKYALLDTDFISKTHLIRKDDQEKVELLTKCRFTAFGTEIMAIIPKIFQLKQKSGLHEEILCYTTRVMVDT